MVFEKGKAPVMAGKKMKGQGTVLCVCMCVCVMFD